MNRRNSDKQNNSSQDDKIPYLPKEIKLQYDTQTIVNLTKALNNLANSKESEKKDQDVIPKGQLHEQVRSNRIAIGAALINGILLLVTAAVFYYNRAGVIAAIHAANLGDTTLKDSRNQFKILNEPFLEITNPTLQFDDLAKTVMLNYKVENLKSFPAQIVFKKTIAVLGALDSAKIRERLILTEKFEYPTLPDQTFFEANGTNRYVINGSPLSSNTFVVPRDIIMDANPDYEPVKSGGRSIVFFVVIKYIDLTSNKPRFYRCVIELTRIFGQIATVYKFNQNSDQ